MKRLVLLFTILLVLSGCSSVKKIVLQTEKGNVPINIEVADTKDEVEKGLMYREKLGNNQGMWFIFPDETPRQFWMENTLIPLDIIFFNSNKNVVSIVEKMQPCRAARCPKYSSEQPAMYALEVPAGFVVEHGVGIGDKALDTK